MINKKTEDESIKRFDSRRRKIELDFKKAEIREKLSAASYDDSYILIKKLEVLERLLSSYKPGEKDFSQETNWIPVMSNDREISIIQNKIIQLVQQL